jgi:hypothetical protein
VGSDIKEKVVDGYIEEHEAIERLEKLTGKKITIEEMKACARLGIVPTYMQFMPKNKDLYSGASFHLADDDAIEYSNMANLTTRDVGWEEDFWKVLPFPLPSDGLVKTTGGLVYRAFVSRNDGRLEAVTEQHYVRVYADQEVRQAAKNVKRYLSKGDVQRINHGCCQTWEMDRDHDHDLTTVWIVGPFADSENSADLKMKNTDLSLSDKLDPRERTSLHLMIAALARKAGYPLDEPNKAEAMLKNDLAFMGICNALNGKGTAANYFEAAKLAADKAKNESK